MDRAEGDRSWALPAAEGDERRAHPELFVTYDLAAQGARGKRVVDCACDTGLGSLLLLRKGATSVVGVDQSQKALEFARKHRGAPGLEFRESDGRTLPLNSDSADLFVSVRSLELVRDAPLFLEEIARVLSPGGQLVLSTPLTTGDLRLRPANPFHAREYDAAELDALLEPRFLVEERLGLAVRAGAAEVQRGRSVLRRFVPASLRAAGRAIFFRRGAPREPMAWVTRDPSAAVQLVVARKRS